MSVVNFPFYGNAIYGAFINLPTGVPDGTLAVTLDTYSLWVYNAGTATWAGVNDQPSSPILLPNGTVALPSLAFANSPATGLYRFAANSIGFSANGVVGGILGALGNWALGSGTTVNTQALLKVSGNAMSGSTAGYGIFLDSTIPVGITTGVENLYSRVNTTATAFTCGYAITISAAAAVAGAGSTITRAIGLLASAQTAGANNAAICDNVAFTGNFFINSTSTNASVLGGLLTLPAGTVGGPALALATAGATSGLYAIAANNLGVACNGAKVLDIGVSGLAVTGVITGSGGVKTIVSIANVSNPPTNAEVVSAFGAAATVGSGFMALMDDNNGHANEYLIWSDGTKYWQVAGTACA